MISVDAKRLLNHILPIDSDEWPAIRWLLMQEFHLRKYVIAFLWIYWSFLFIFIGIGDHIGVKSSFWILYFNIWWGIPYLVVSRSPRFIRSLPIGRQRLNDTLWGAYVALPAVCIVSAALPILLAEFLQGYLFAAKFLNILFYASLLSFTYVLFAFIGVVDNIIRASGQQDHNSPLRDFCAILVILSALPLNLMALYHAAMVLFIITTAGNLLSLWASHWLRRYFVPELLRGRKKAAACNDKAMPGPRSRIFSLLWPFIKIGLIYVSITSGLMLTYWLYLYNSLESYELDFDGFAMMLFFSAVFSSLFSFGLGMLWFGEFRPLRTFPISSLRLSLLTMVIMIIQWMLPIGSILLILALSGKFSLAEHSAFIACILPSMISFLVFAPWFIMRRESRHNIVWGYILVNFLSLIFFPIASLIQELGPFPVNPVKIALLCSLPVLALVFALGVWVIRRYLDDSDTYLVRETPT